MQASLLVESSDRVGRFTFEHALINHTLYQGLGGTRRARMHLQVAEALEELYGSDAEEHLAELALHWRLATVSVDKHKAAGYSLRAGQRALDSLAPSEAAKLFADALELLGPGATIARCEALIGLGDAQRQTGDAGVPGDAAARRLGSRRTLRTPTSPPGRRLRTTAASRAGSGWSMWSGSRRSSGRSSSIDPPQPARHARLLALLAQELTFEPEHARRRALAEEAIALARQAGDPRTLAAVLADSYYACWAPDTLAERAGHVLELKALVAQVRDLQRRVPRRAPGDDS